MGKHGPPPYPAAKLKYTGTQADRVRERERCEPAAGGTPERPDWLDDAGLAEWDRLFDMLDRVPGMLTEIDAHMLALAAQALADVKYMRAQLGTAWIVKGQRDKEYVRSPLAIMLCAREKDLAKLLIEFGMSPAARARISVDGGTKGGDEFAAEYLDGSTG